MQQGKPLVVWSTVHAPHTSDRARPAGTASETSASLCKLYAGHSFIVVASELAESRSGLVSAVAFARRFVDNASLSLSNGGFPS